MTDADPLIGDVSRQTGVPVETLRYYDRVGLLGDLPRNASGRRVFDEASLGLLDVVVRLRRTGMPVEDVRRFAAMLGQGDDALEGRLELLAGHQARVAAQLQQLERDLDVIDWKVAAYTAIRDGRPPPEPPPGWPDPHGLDPDLG